MIFLASSVNNFLWFCPVRPHLCSWPFWKMTKSKIVLWPTSEYNMPRVLLLCCVANFPNCDILSHTEVHRLDNSVITTLSCSVNNRSHHKWLSEHKRLIFCSIYNFIWSSCEIWKLHQNYLLMFIVKLISEPSWAALFIFLVQQLVLKVKCRNKYLQPRKRSHVWRLVRVEKFCQDYKVPPMVHHPHLNTNHVLLRPLRSPQSEYTHTIIVVAMDSIIIVNAICDMFIE